jgi:hypothetical protein
MRIIDTHIHIGKNPRTKYYDLGDLERDLSEAGAHGAVIFAFPEDIYRKIDSPDYRLEANKYILEVAEKSKKLCLYPFYFVWNDYILPEDLGRYAGIKWHRHTDEPRYDYKDPRSSAFLRRVKELKMPVLMEEGFAETFAFIEQNPELDVIIPHMGKLNGGYRSMEAFFSNPRVYFDTSTAEPSAIRWILQHVGPKRIIFASDVSGTREPFFNFPKVELRKIMGLGLDEKALEKILSGNIERLMEPWLKRLHKKENE